MHGNDQSNSAQSSSKRWIFLGILLAAVLGYVGYRLYFPARVPYVDTSAQDRVSMWETMDTTSGRASTPKAAKAAHHFFIMTSLIGKTREEIIAAVGDPEVSTDSVYKAPFFPVQPGTLVYRFDTGAGGWQFDVHFDSYGRATQVLERGIR